MTTTHTNIAIVEGEVHIFSESDATRSDYLNIIASTKYMENVPQLDRKHFVKPKIIADWHEMSKDTNIYSGTVGLIYEKGYRDGYNYKEAEFTMDDMESAFKAGMESINMFPSTSELFNRFINKIHPLSRPKSITTDENYNVISVQWE